MNKTNELHTLLSKIIADIVLLGKTRINLLKSFKITNYHIYQSDNASKNVHPYGGTALLVHRRIIHKHISLNTTIKSTSVEISLGSDIVRISAVYKINPPTSLSLTAIYVS